MPISEAQKRAQKKYYENNKDRLIPEYKRKYKNLTVSTALYTKLLTLAKNAKISMSKFIENLLEK